MRFRKDINGLRAIAVVGVVLFHFNPVWMPGGFAGVDVFFVISGFLMTGIIFRGIEQQNFSILRFYVARANRVIPALAALCLVLLVFGWFYLTPHDYQALGVHAGSSVGFFSNIVYWRESGYFDAASHEKWLLHTWSLSAEWQFYMIYPLVLVAMRKFMAVTSMKAVVLLGTVFGFIFCAIITYKWPNPAYYLLPTRVWEMTIGGVAYLYPFALKEGRKKLLECFGFALIIGSYFFISNENPWPGYLAIFPVLGSFLIVQAQCNNSFITQNVVSQKIGTWSYSIYLWHWPIAVLFYFEGLKFEVVGILISGILGFISYSFIEQKRTRLSLIVVPVLFIPFFFGIYYDDKNLAKAELFDVELEAFRYVYSNPDCNFRASDPITRIQMERDSISQKCYTSDKKSILLHGDSHSQHLFYGLEKHFGSKFDILQISASSCRLEPIAPKDGCKASNDLFRAEVSQIKPDVLILTVRDDFEKVNWKNYLSKLTFVDEILILGPSPINDFFKMKYRDEFNVINWEYMLSTDIYMRNELEIIEAEYPNVTYVSMRELLCQDGVSSCLSMVDGENIYADGSHLSRAGSIEVIRLLKGRIQAGEL